MTNRDHQNDDLDILLRECFQTNLPHKDHQGVWARLRERIAAHQLASRVDFGTRVLSDLGVSYTHNLFCEHLMIDLTMQLSFRSAR
jgi:hypothetical protein